MSYFTQHRPLMFSLASRMTGSGTDAEDMVQEAFLRVGKAPTSSRRRRTWPRPPPGWPSTTCARPGSAELEEASDSLSMAFLVLLDSLSPAERPRLPRLASARTR